MAENAGYRDLAVWQKAMDMTVLVYELSGTFPKHELYGLTSQMRRCAASVPANIAEGRGRCGDSEFRRFLNIAAGSLAELETFLELAARLEYADPDQLEATTTVTREVGKMLHGLLRTVSRSVTS